MDVKNDNIVQDPKQLNLIGDPSKLVPKICTSVNFAVINNDKVIFTFTYKEGPGPEILIERVLVDLTHAQQIHRILGEVIQKTLKQKNDKSK